MKITDLIKGRKIIHGLRNKEKYTDKKGGVNIVENIYHIA